jgi:hypothetical protein
LDNQAIKFLFSENLKLMTNSSRFGADNNVKLINGGRILESSKTLPKSFLVRDIVLQNVFDLYPIFQVND